MTDTGIPTVLNPLLSPELRAEVEFFQKWGYLVVENATTTEQVEVLRQAIDLAYQEAQSQFIDDLLEEDDRFLFLLDNPPVLQRIKAILGNCIQLHSATSRVLLLSRVKTIRIGIGTAPGQSTPTVRPMVAYRDRSTVATSWTS